jgi:hypothetical protein
MHRTPPQGAVRQVLARSKYDPSDILAKLVFWTIMLFVLQLAALDQLQIAPRIVTGLWYAILAAVVGSVIVAVGGGGIRTMQRYWERTASRAEQRGPQLRDQARASAQTSTPQTPDYPPTYDDARVGTGSSATEEFSPGRSRRRDR